MSAFKLLSQEKHSHFTVLQQLNYQQWSWMHDSKFLNIFIFASMILPASKPSFTLILFALLQIMPEKEKKQKKSTKVKHKTSVPPPQTLASRREFSSPSPSLPSSLSSSPSSSSGAAPVAAPVDQKKFVDAALRMIAEDMLPLR